MQFVVTAFDHPGSETLRRRLEVRPSHLDRVRALETGAVLSAGAILNGDGDPIGSSMHVDFPSRDAVDAWLDADPYRTEGVWDSVEVWPIRLVDFS